MQSSPGRRLYAGIRRRPRVRGLTPPVSATQLKMRRKPAGVGQTDSLELTLPSRELAVSKRQLINIVRLREALLLYHQRVSCASLKLWQQVGLCKGSSCREGGVIKWKNTNTSRDKTPPVHSLNTSYSRVH